METKQSTNPGIADEQKIVEAGRGNPANATPAHEAAEADMQSDPDFATEPEKGNELDEGELAQLEGED